MCLGNDGVDVAAEDLFRAVKQAIRDGNKLPPDLVSKTKEWLGDLAIAKAKKAATNSPKMPPI